VLKRSFSGSEVGLGVNNISVEFHSEVVVDLLGWVLVFITFPGPFVSDDLLGFSEVLEGVLDSSVHTEAWNWVVLWPVSGGGVWVLVLVASGGGADWVGLELHKVVLMIKGSFGGGEVLLGINDITIEFHGEVIVDLLGWVLIFSSFPSPVLSDDLFGFSEVTERVGDISVHTEGWDTIVLWPVSDGGVWVLVLVASG
jgi:hypothetical protein